MTSVPYRIGTGYDTHQLGEDRPLIVGGISIPHSLGLIGHSDADILLHSITDAILGALGEGDIGEHFPDTDPEFKGMDSIIFLNHALKLMKDKSWYVGNLDCTIFAQKPKLKDFKPIIKKHLAEVMSLEENQINIKAKTGEKVGPVGREEAMSASATILLIRNDTL